MTKMKKGKVATKPSALRTKKASPKKAVNSTRKAAEPKKLQAKGVKPASGVQKKRDGKEEVKEAKRPINQKLLEMLEKRTAARKAQLVKVPGRRGRKPKNPVDYNPDQPNEDYYAVENEYESIEYDTGIRVSSHKEDAGFTVDRPDDFDEELNFDW